MHTSALHSHNYVVLAKAPEEARKAGKPGRRASFVLSAPRSFRASNR